MGTRTLVRISSRWRCGLGILGAVVAIGLIGSTASARAATIHPTRSDDPSGAGHCPTNCSLRQAVAYAKAGDTISLAPPAPQRTYVLTQGPLSIDEPLTIAGVSARQSAITASSGGIFSVASTGVTISHVELTGDQASGDEVVGENSGASLTLLSSSISDNTGATAISADSSDLFILRSTIAHNGGFGISAGGVTLQISDSTIAGNYGALGLSLAGDTTTIASTTIARNGNSGGLGNMSVAGGSLTIRNSIVAAGIGSPGNCSTAGVTETVTYSIEDQDQCGFDGGAGNHVNTNPQLLGLGNHGGPTNTLALASTSPAINAGDPSGCTAAGGQALSTDQRGAARTGRCDIGAFEYQPPPANTIRPKVEGTARAGAVVSCGLGQWSGGRPLRFAVQWLENGAAIKGAVRRRYLIPGDASGQELSCRVTAANFSSSSRATSRAVRVKPAKR